MVREVNRWATDGVMPELTIVLDCEIAEARRRKGWFTDRFERGGEAFLARVRQGYLEVARQEPERVRVISSSGPKDVTAELVWTTVASALNL